MLLHDVISDGLLLPTPHPQSATSTMTIPSAEIDRGQMNEASANILAEALTKQQNGIAPGVPRSPSLATRRLPATGAMSARGNTRTALPRSLCHSEDVGRADELSV